MNLTFATELRILKYNNYYYVPESFSMVIWERYLSVFDHIFLLARVDIVCSLPMSSLSILQDSRVSVIELPTYNGIFNYLNNKKDIKEIIREHAKKGNAYILRVPGQIGTITAEVLNKLKIPFAVEIVGDPWEALSATAFRHPLAPLLQYIGKNNLRKVASRASASLYVTSHILQEKYPPKANTFTTNASNVQLTSQDILTETPNITGKPKNGVYKFISVGTLAQLYKAPDVILKALGIFKSHNIPFKFYWFGDGACKESMIKLAESLGLSDQVSFEGNVSPQRLKDEMLSTDIFIHASRAEGLPRALIEAMSQGLPAIGSNVAGIPELLMPDVIIPPDDAEAIVEKLLNFIKNQVLMQKHANHNLNESRKYVSDILTKRRTDFYNAVKELSKG